MLVDLTQKFVSIDGKILKDVSITENDGIQTRVTKDLTLERVINLALAEPVDQKMSGGNKIKCFELLLRVIAHKVGIIELESDDITFIKDLIRPKFTVVIVGEAMRMLEGKDIGITIVEDKDESKTIDESELDIPEDVGDKQEDPKIDPPEGIDEDIPDLPSPKDSDENISEPDKEKINEDFTEPKEPVIDKV